MTPSRPERWPCSESAVYGFQSISSLQQVRQAARAASLNTPAAIDGPKPRKPQPCTWSELVKGWALPFPGAPLQLHATPALQITSPPSPPCRQPCKLVFGDWLACCSSMSMPCAERGASIRAKWRAGADASVVRRTMSARSAAGLPVAHYLASFVIRSRVNLALFMACGAVLQWLARSAAGAAALLRCPGLFTLGSFSHDGPTEQQLAGTSFRMQHFGYALDAATQTPATSPSVRFPCCRGAQPHAMAACDEHGLMWQRACRSS